MYNKLFGRMFNFKLVVLFLLLLLIFYLGKIYSEREIYYNESLASSLESITPKVWSNGNATDNSLRIVSNDDLKFSGVISHADSNTFSRLPESIEKTIGSDVGGRIFRYGRHLSGGIISFSTNSKKIHFEAKVITPRSEHGIMSSNGVDLYINESYQLSAAANKDMISFDADVSSIKEYADIEIYLPVWGAVSDVRLYLDRDSVILKSPEKEARPLVAFYGSSITQGCCASNSGMTYPAIFSRLSNVNFVNLGFAGSGIGHMEIIDYMISLNPDYIVLDYWANPDARSYQISLPYVIERISSKLPHTPIYVLGTFYNTGREEIQREKDLFAQRAVKSANDSGLNQVYFIEGLFKKEDSFGLYDGRHLNSAGFYLVATRLSNRLDISKPPE